MSKHIHTATADVETRILKAEGNTIDIKSYAASLAKTHAADITQCLTNGLHGEHGEKIIMRVSVKIEIERE